LHHEETDSGRGIGRQSFVLRRFIVSEAEAASQWAIRLSADILDGMPSDSDPNAVAPLARSPEMMTVADTALLVIDMQERLTPAIPDSARIVWNCRRLLAGAKILGVRAWVTEQNPAKLGPTAPQLAALCTEPVAAKMAFSCGACGEIYAAWRQLGIERVLLCGIETHVCVAQTTLDLLAAGYEVYVAADAVGARGALDHDVALRRLESGGAVLTTVEAALFEWCGQAGTPEFRQISALVKEPAPIARS
jgi:nicotinamidase-related amidase